MIQFSKIDAELSIYKEKEVVIFGASSTGKKVKEILEKNGIKIKAVIDNDTKKVGKDFYGTKIYSLSELQGVLSNNYIVQIASVYEREIEKQLQEIHADYILYSEFDVRIQDLRRYLLSKKYPKLKQYMYESLWDRVVFEQISRSESYLLNNAFNNMDTINILIAPPKTGNNSLLASLVKSGGEFFSQGHTYSFISNNLQEFIKERKINLVIGVRDIIAQHISLFFQDIGDYWDLDEYWINGGDVQKIFDIFYMSEDEQLNCWYNYELLRDKNKKKKLPYFFDLQFKTFWDIDVYQLPFDTEKGYSIYRFGNLNIMIYQLEKMNLLEKEIGQFFQIKEFKLIKINDSQDKWYSSLYERTKRKLRLDGNYFEKCYSGKFMNHFYSSKDIAIFKEKWKKNVK